MNKKLKIIECTPGGCIHGGFIEFPFSITKYNSHLQEMFHELTYRGQW